MHPLSGALLLPYAHVPARVIRIALVTHKPSFAPPRCTEELLSTSHYHYINILMTRCLMVLDWRVLRAEPMPSYSLNLLFIFISYILFSLFIPSMGWLCAVRVLGLKVSSHSLTYLHCRLIFNNNN